MRLIKYAAFALIVVGRLSAASADLFISEDEFSAQSPPANAAATFKITSAGGPIIQTVISFYTGSSCSGTDGHTEYFSPENITFPTSGSLSANQVFYLNGAALYSIKTATGANLNAGSIYIAFEQTSGVAPNWSSGCVATELYNGSSHGSYCCIPLTCGSSSPCTGSTSVSYNFSF